MKKLLLGAILLFQTACTSYQYIEPVTEEGKYCVKNCLDKKWDCNSFCQANHSRCLGGSGVNISLFNNFTNQGDNQLNPYQEKAKICKSAQYDCDRSCSNNYNSCFISCGGAIVEQQ